MNKLEKSLNIFNKYHKNKHNNILAIGINEIAVYLDPILISDPDDFTRLDELGWTLMCPLHESDFEHLPIACNDISNGLSEDGRSYFVSKWYHHLTINYRKY
jgi:hypothetical protein